MLFQHTAVSLTGLCVCIQGYGHLYGPACICQDVYSYAYRHLYLPIYTHLYAYPHTYHRTHLSCTSIGVRDRVRLRRLPRPAARRRRAFPAGAAEGVVAD